MGIETVNVAITSYDEAADLMYVQVGLFGHPFRISEFKAIASGEQKNPAVLIANLAMRVGIDGVDMNDKAAIEASVEAEGAKF